MILTKICYGQQSQGSGVLHAKPARNSSTDFQQHCCSRDGEISWMDLANPCRRAALLCDARTYHTGCWSRGVKETGRKRTFKGTFLIYSCGSSLHSSSSSSLKHMSGSTHLVSRLLVCCFMCFHVADSVKACERYCRVRFSTRGESHSPYTA